MKKGLLLGVIAMIVVALSVYLQTKPEELGNMRHSFTSQTTTTSTVSFPGEAEEIRFFKEIKPRFFSLLIYYSNVYNIEMRMPVGSTDDKRNHLVRTQEKIRNFFDMNLELYGYYRSGSTHLDHIYFLRGKQDARLPIDSLNFERDSCFSTCCDFRMAGILANEKEKSEQALITIQTQQEQRVDEQKAAEKREVDEVKRE